MKLKYLFTTLLAGAMFMSGCTEVSLENPLEELQVSSSYVNIPMKGGETEITVTATAAWAFTESLIPEGVTVSPLSGDPGTTSVTFSADATDQGIEATTLEIVVNGKSQYIVFSQMDADYKPTYTSVKDVLAATEDGKIYYVKGVVESIKDEDKGVLTIYEKDETTTSELNVEGILDADGKENGPEGMSPSGAVRAARREISAYALLTEPNSAMSSLVRSTIASRPGFSSLRGS